ncbi:MAG: restriction endonuclease subunit S [Candidatus Aminicenantes bacterium]|nr:restriction endonuclease subunit S [Candidatus Aminicenantes bacterium]
MKIRQSSVPCTVEPMSVPFAYKMSEIGIIPKDWDLIKLGQIAEIRNGSTPNTQVSKFWNGTIPWCTPTDITATKGKYLEATKKYITKIGLSSCSANLLPPGTLLLCSRATIGELKITKTNICTNQGFKSLVCKSDVLNEFLYYLILFLKPKFIERANGSTFLEISKQDLANILIQLPGLDEQHAIAEALSDVDRLIEALDKLIIKKRNVKRATMQQLLTGKTRLPGFEGDWISLNIGKQSLLKARIGWQGLTTEEYLRTGNYYLVTGTDFINGEISWETCDFVTKHRYDQDKYIQLSLGDILLTKDGTIGKSAYINKLPFPATLNSGVFVIRPLDNAYNPKYLFYLLMSQVFMHFLNKLQAGSTITHLYQKDFIGFDFLAPPTLEEQTAVVTILSELDAEIKALEFRLDKTKQIKQGMMQQLLTGRVRLIKREAAD